MRAQGSVQPRAGRYRAACLMLLAALALLSAPARAHEMSMAEMEVRETAPGEFLWLWSATNDKRPMGNDLVPHWKLTNWSL